MGTYYLSLVARNVVYELRKELFAKLLVLPNHYYHIHSAGHLSAKLIYDVEQVTEAASEALKTMVREGFTVIALLAYLLHQLAFVFIVIDYRADSGQFGKSGE